MRFIFPILFVFIISCNGNTASPERDKKMRDSTAIAYRNYCDSLHKIKRKKFLALKKQIPFSQNYYEWCEITFNHEIISDQNNTKYHCIGIGEDTEPDLLLYNDCYSESSGSYSIFNIFNEKNDVLFNTVSEKRDTVLWKIKFLTKDSTIAEWSYKKNNDKEFTSMASFMTKKNINTSTQ